MKSHDLHPSDQKLLMAVDGELSTREAARVESHLAACWGCRARKQDLEAAIDQFMHFHRSSLEDQIPSPDGPKALLKARLSHLEETPNARPRWVRLWEYRPGWAAILAVSILAGISAFMWPGSRDRPTPVSVTLPNPVFTPGATVLATRPEVCRQSPAKNKEVLEALRRRVFAEYGIPNARPEYYEVDYLITPALGGADDIHNLWPESNRGVLWNAEAKDELEDHLRTLVCEGRVDLQTAQREIATDWIQAYKKYFHTERPLGELQQFHRLLKKH